MKQEKLDAALYASSDFRLIKVTFIMESSVRAALRILLRINGLNLPMKKVSGIKRIQFPVGFVVMLLFR